MSTPQNNENKWKIYGPIINIVFFGLVASGFAYMVISDNQRAKKLEKEKIEQAKRDSVENKLFEECVKPQRDYDELIRKCTNDKLVKLGFKPLNLDDYTNCLSNETCDQKIFLQTELAKIQCQKQIKAPLDLIPDSEVAGIKIHIPYDIQCLSLIKK